MQCGFGAAPLRDIASGLVGAGYLALAVRAFLEPDGARVPTEPERESSPTGVLPRGCRFIRRRLTASGTDRPAISSTNCASSRSPMPIEFGLKLVDSVTRRFDL